MHFYSDNCGPALPQVMAALNDANTGYMPSYGDDPIMDQVRAMVRDEFEAPEAAVYLVATGTAANVLGLSVLAQPYHRIFCTPLAHIEVDECNGPEMFAGGAKLTLVGTADKMTAQDLETAIAEARPGDVHGPQPGPVSLTQVTEMGRLYTLEELSDLSTVAHTHGCGVHMDGARFSNALQALGCTPAEMTWRAGVDVLSFGGSKNGCMGVEAVVLFDPDKAWEFELRRKRGAQLFSKHRYLSAQMQAYLSNGLWRRTADLANARAARLIAGLRKVPGCLFEAEPEANMIFARLPRAAHQRLHAAGAVYGLFEGPLDSGDPEEPLLMRLVCDWSVTDAQVDQFVEIAIG